MTDHIAEHDGHMFHFTSQTLAAAQDRQPHMKQHVPAQYSRRCQNIRHNELSSRQSRPYRRMLHREDMPWCYAKDSDQMAVMQDFKSRPNNYQNRHQVAAVSRPSIQHTDTMHSFRYYPNMPALNKDMPDQLDWSSTQKGHEYLDLLFAPVHNHRIYSAPMMSTYDQPSTMPLGADGVPPAFMQQVPSVVENANVRNVNQEPRSIEPGSQLGMSTTAAEYVPWQMKSPHQLSSQDNVPGFKTAYDSTSRRPSPILQGQEVDVVQEELIGLGLYDDGPHQSSRSVTPGQSHVQASASSDRPTFLLGEGWEPPESEEDEDDEESEDASSTSEDFAYLNTAFEPVVKQTQQMQWPIFQNDQKPQPQSTIDLNGHFYGAQYWPQEHMGPMINTSGQGPIWAGYGYQ